MAKVLPKRGNDPHQGAKISAPPPARTQIPRKILEVTGMEERKLVGFFLVIFFFGQRTGYLFIFWPKKRRLTGNCVLQLPALK